jgi:hypothetical protein
MTGVVLTTALVLQRDGRATYPVDAYFAAFDRLVACGLPIVLYLEPALAGRSFPPQVTVIPQALEDLPTWRATHGLDLRLPPHRNERKDTLDYLAIVNSKPGLVARTVAMHPAAATHAWVDFGLFHVIRDDATAHRRLRSLSVATPGDRLVLPGCTTASHDDWRKVDWRFCGGFFHGSAGAVLQFARLHERAFHALLPAVTWEVNLWARLEKHHGLDCRWYAADHDDRILDFASAGPPGGP